MPETSIKRRIYGVPGRSNLCSFRTTGMVRFTLIGASAALVCFWVTGCQRSGYQATGTLLDGYRQYSLIFVSEEENDQEICLLDLATMSVRNLSRNEADDVSPVWWSQGKKIIFGSNRSGNGDLYVMNPDGSESTRLIGGPNPQHSPAMTPDGTTLAYVELHGDLPRIHLFDLERGRDVVLDTGPGPVANPAWSPDGRKIAFDCEPDSSPGVLQATCVMERNRPSAERKTLPPPDSNINGWVESYWHPDGDSLVYVAGFGTNRGLYHFNLSMGTAITVSNGLGQDRYPAVSLDGKLIACVSNLSEAGVLGFIERFNPLLRTPGLVLVALDNRERELIYRDGVALDRPVWARSIDLGS